MAEEKKPSPPPIPFSEVYEKSSPQGKQETEKTEEISDLYEIPEPILKEIIAKRDRLNPLLRDYKDLKVRPYFSRPLLNTNTFFYTPSVPILMQFPEGIKKVIHTSPQQVVFDGNYLVAIPPDPTTDLFNFVVVLENNNPYYFFGERGTNSQAKEKTIIPFIIYTRDKSPDPYEVILHFFRKYKRCPSSGETVEVENSLYRFEIKRSPFLINNSYVSFCNNVYIVKKMNP